MKQTPIKGVKKTYIKPKITPKQNEFKLSPRNYYATQAVFSWLIAIIICLLLVLNCFNNKITFRGILDEISSSYIYAGVQQAFKDSGDFLNIPNFPTGDVPGISTLIKGVNSLLNFVGSLCQLAYCLRAFILESFKFFWNILSYLLGF